MPCPHWPHHSIVTLPLTPTLTLALALALALGLLQVDGVKFMFKNVTGSVSKLRQGGKGSGCILAHCMGLGESVGVSGGVSGAKGLAWGPYVSQ